MIARVTLGRLIADCGPIHVAGEREPDGWTITLRDDAGEVVPKHRLRGGERAHLVDLLEAAGEGEAHG